MKKVSNINKVHHLKSEKIILSLYILDAVSSPDTANILLGDSRIKSYKVKKKRIKATKS